MVAPAIQAPLGMMDKRSKKDSKSSVLQRPQKPLDLHSQTIHV